MPDRSAGGARLGALVQMLQASPQVTAQQALNQRLATGSADGAEPAEGALEEPLQGKFAPEAVAAPDAPQAPNKTGLPDGLKSGIEALSGISLDPVRVHYNSSQPAQLNAHAYAQGTEIHLAPGQEQHLPHEAWHVVQQAQGRVKPTLQMHGGVAVNDDTALEREADAMGAKAVGAVNLPEPSTIPQRQVKRASDQRILLQTASHDRQGYGKPVIQAMFTFTVNEDDFKVTDLTYLRPKAGGNLISRSKEYKHVTADISKRAIIEQNEGKRIDEFGRNLALQAQTYASLPVVNMIDYFDDEYGTGVGAIEFKSTLEKMNTSKDKVWEMSEIFAKAEGDSAKMAAAFQLQNRISKLLKYMDEFRDQLPLATVYDPHAQKQQGEAEAIATLQSDDKEKGEYEIALWTLMDPKALVMVLDSEDLKDELPWLDIDKFKSEWSSEIEERVEKGEDGDAILRHLVAAFMIKTHIKLMQSTFGEKANIIDSEKSIREMMRKNDLTLFADEVIAATEY